MNDSVKEQNKERPAVLPVFRFGRSNLRENYREVGEVSNAAGKRRDGMSYFIVGFTDRSLGNMADMQHADNLGFNPKDDAVRFVDELSKIGAGWPRLSGHGTATGKQFE
jgi:hypothetical protein